MIHYIYIPLYTCISQQAVLMSLLKSVVNCNFETIEFFQIFVSVMVM